jgi:hypothetical protein
MAGGKMKVGELGFIASSARYCRALPRSYMTLFDPLSRLDDLGQGLLFPG